MAKIIVTSYHTGGVNAIIPVVKKLREERRLEFVVIGYKNSEGIFSNAGIDFRTLGSYDLQDASVGSIEQILARESPDLVLTGPSMQSKGDAEVIEHSITLAARQRRIPTLAVLDSWTFYVQKFSDYHNNGIYDPNYAGGKFRFLPDKIAVIDELARRAMLELGFDKNILVVTGNPYYDQLSDLKTVFKEADRNKIRAELCVDPNAVLVVYASQPIEKRRGMSLGFTEKTVLKELADELEEFIDENVCLVVKTHPSEDVWNLGQIWGLKATNNFGYPIVIDNNLARHPWNVVLASNLIVSPYSTTLVEACFLDKPAISLQPGLVGEDQLSFNQLGITVPIYRHGEISSVLEKLLLGDRDFDRELAERRKKLVNDGKATERVINLIYEMIN